MIGTDLYKTDVNFELSGERLKSLVLFYEPLIGSGAMALYENLVLRKSSAGFGELNSLLNSLNKSVDSFEEFCEKLNEYRLLKTLKKDNQYIFVFMPPLTMKEFIKDDVLVRKFILKTSGTYYQELSADIFEDNNYYDYSDVSKKLPLESLNDWNADDETYVSGKRNDNYDFKTRFNINVFLKDMSTTLLPMKYRTRENLEQIALLGDIYNISYDMMRTYVARTVNSDKQHFDLNALKKSCMAAKSTYQKVNDDQYDTPSINYLMSLQNGKEVSRYDKMIIYNLANDYHLNVPVINVLLKHTLENCDNRLFEKYLYGIASDLNRNDVDTAIKAIDFLQREKTNTYKNKDSLPVYDTSGNIPVSDKEKEELLKLMGKI